MLVIYHMIELLNNIYGFIYECCSLNLSLLEKLLLLFT